MRIKHLKVEALSDAQRDHLIEAYVIEFGEEFRPLFINCMAFFQCELLRHNMAMNPREYILGLLRRVAK